MIRRLLDHLTAVLGRESMNGLAAIESIQAHALDILTNWDPETGLPR